jgi:hypothetical protein
MVVKISLLIIIVGTLLAYSHFASLRSAKEPDAATPKRQG